MSFLWNIFEGGQHQSVANQQSPKSIDSLHNTCNGSTPDPFFSATISKEKNQSGHARLPYMVPEVQNFPRGLYIP